MTNVIPIDVHPSFLTVEPLLAPVMRKTPTTYADLMKVPMPRLTELTMQADRVEQGKAIAAWVARLPTSGIGWDDLTTRQQQRWTELVKMSSAA